jgi:hypothetical protein
MKTFGLFNLHRYFQSFQFGLGGTEGLLLSAALSGVGMYMQQQNQDAVARKEQRILNQGAEEDARLSKAKSQDIANFANDNFEIGNRDQNYENVATKNETSLVDALNKANDTSGNSQASTAQGKVSSDYLKSKTDANARSSADILKRAHLMSRANANGLLYGQDAMAGNQLNANTAGYEGASSRNRGYTNTKLGAIDRSGSLIGGLMQGFAPVAGGLSLGSAKDLAPSGWATGILGVG